MATDIAAPFPDITWKDQSIIEVDAGDSNAVITTFTIHLAQNVPEELLKAPVIAPLFAYGPDTA